MKRRNSGEEPVEEKCRIVDNPRNNKQRNSITDSSNEANIDDKRGKEKDEDGFALTVNEEGQSSGKNVDYCDK